MINNPTDEEYRRLLKLVLSNGKWKSNRTGVSTLSVFGEQAKFNLLEGFPILTTKEVWFKGIVHELLWFLSGSSNVRPLIDAGVNFWTPDAHRNYKTKYQSNILLGDYLKMVKDSLSPTFTDLGFGTYGSMWRKYPAPEEVDQITELIYTLSKTPDDRRMIVNAWHPYWAKHCALPPCHVMFMCNTEELTLEERLTIFANSNFGRWKTHADVPGRKLNLLMFQRSCDLFLGVPFNITSYALLLSLIAHCVDMVPGVFTHTYGDLHIYANHMEAVTEQLQREDGPLPRLELNKEKKYILSFTPEDIKLSGYINAGKIKADLNVG